MKPTIGRIVHYVTKDLGVRPAIIVNVFDRDACNLQVFTDGPNDSGNKDLSNGGVVWKGTVEYNASPDPKSGTWQWPTRIEEKAPEPPLDPLA